MKKTEVDFQKKDKDWAVTQNGVAVFKKPPTGKMKPAKAVILKATKGSDHFKLIIITEEE